MQTDTPQWWGTFEIPIGGAGSFRIGPCTLELERLPGELCVATHDSGNDDDDELEIAIPAASVANLAEREHVRRCALADDVTELTISAQLADEAVVASPRKPVSIPATGAITMYIGSPVWLRLEAGKFGHPLLDLPLHQPPKTWFGPSARHGELCYASRTHSRLRLDDLSVRPHRAITCVEVKNRAQTPFVLDVLKLPVPYLGLYRAENGALWTQDVVLERDDREFSPLEIRSGAPRHADNAVRESEPRRSSNNLMVRAFSSLFSS